MVLLETPSRVWRRIEANKQHDREMPSLPSLPEAEDSNLSSESATVDGQILPDNVSGQSPSSARASRDSLTVPSTIQRSHSIATETPSSSTTNRNFSVSGSNEEPRGSALVEPEKLNATSSLSVDNFTPMPRVGRGLFAGAPAGRRISDTYTGNITNLATPGPRRTQFLLDVINTGTRPKHVNVLTQRLGVRAPYTPAAMTRTSSDSSATPFNAPSTIKRMPKTSTPYIRVSTEEFTPSSQTSFISVASSHDLLMSHLPTQNPHTSFDPAVARHGDGGTVNRFDAPRLNSYLHSLNSQLAKENCYLVDIVQQLKRYIEGDSQAEVPDLSQLGQLPGNENLEARLKQIQEEERSIHVSYAEQVEQEVAEALDKARSEWEQAKLALLREHGEECQALVDAREKDSIQWQQRIKKASEDAEEILLQIEKQRDDTLKRLHFVEGTLKETSSDATEAITRLEEELHSRELRIQGLMHETSTLKDKHSAALQEVEAETAGLLAETEDQHRNKVKVMEEEITRLRNRELIPDPSEGQQQVDHEELLRLEEENESLWNQLKEVKAKLELKNSETENLKVKVLELQRQVDVLRGRVDQLSEAGETFASQRQTPPPHMHSMSFKTPKTPGAPLRDITWINNTTRGEDNAELMQQIHILDKQLREANRVIESKMRALDEQGLTTVDISSQMKALTRELEAAQRDIGAFKEREEELKMREAELKQMGFEATTELDRIKKDLQRAQSHLSNVKNERDEALRQVDNLEARARLDRLERDRWRVDQVATDDRLKELVGKVDDAESLVQQTTSEKQAQDRKLSQLQFRLEENVKENQDLHEKLHSARSQILASQKALNEVKRFKDRDQDGVPDLVAKLRVSLQQVQQDADEFRDDLARLREDKQTSEDAHRGEIAQLQERLGSSREAKYDEGLHKDECRGLLVQISYLQDKWTREATFRYDLQFTKRYLLTLYAAALGHKKTIPLSKYPPFHQQTQIRFKSLAMGVLFLVRARRAADTWRKQRECRGAIELALEGVHRRRAARLLDLV